MKSVVVDGYNLIHQAPSFRSMLKDGLERCREAVVACCAQWLSLRRDVQEFLIVFDGDPSVQRVNALPTRIRVVFSRVRKGADEAIIRHVQALPDPSGCTVITDDDAILRAVRLLGARTLPCRDFLRTARGRRAPDRSPTDGKNGLTPLQRARINDELLQAWNLR